MWAPLHLWALFAAMWIFYTSHYHMGSETHQPTHVTRDHPQTLHPQWRVWEWSAPSLIIQKVAIFLITSCSNL